MTDQPPSHLDQLTPGAALLGREFLGFDADGKTVVEAEIFDPEGNVVARATAKMRIVRRK